MLTRWSVRRVRPSDAAQLLAGTGHGALEPLLHSSNRPMHVHVHVHVVHLQHRTGLCSSMPGVQHNDQHHPASAAYPAILHTVRWVQDCVPLYLDFRLGSEHRTCDAGTVHEVDCAGAKGPESCGRGLVAKSVPAKA